MKNTIPRGLDCVRKLAKNVHGNKLEGMSVNGMSWFLPPFFCCVFLPCLPSVVNYLEVKAKFPPQVAFGQKAVRRKLEHDKLRF